MPLSNAFLDPSSVGNKEQTFPLHVFVCESCLLVQVPMAELPENIFSEYAYFSSFSQSWLEHARRYAEEMTTQLGLGRESLVVEIASNDGYLLRFFRDKGIRVLGIEPAGNVAAVAEAAGIPTLREFFGAKLAKELGEAGQFPDLLLGNNVVAHVPELKDFVRGLKWLLKRDGVITLEFPHILRLIQDRQFDTIYHEHFSYFSLFVLARIFEEFGLRIFKVEQLPTHGGSLRIFATHIENDKFDEDPSVQAVLNLERDAGLKDIRTYTEFANRIEVVRQELLAFLKQARNEGKQVVGYGAPAKGNTLLNFCGVDSSLIRYTVDLNPYKQGRFLPGSKIPILEPARIRETRPDFVLILPWNLKEEITEQLAFIREWGGQFVIPIPKLAIFA